MTESNDAKQQEQSELLDGMQKASSTGLLIMGLMADGAEWTVRRVMFTRSLSLAGRAVAAGAGLFVFLHLIPRYLFHVYGVIWGTLFPIAAAIAASGGVLYALFQGAMLAVVYLRVNAKLGKLGGHTFFCKACGRELRFDKQSLVELVNARLQTSHGMGGTQGKDLPIVCSEACAEKIKDDSEASRFCWLCGKEDVPGGGCVCWLFAGL